MTEYAIKNVKLENEIFIYFFHNILVKKGLKFPPGPAKFRTHLLACAKIFNILQCFHRAAHMSKHTFASLLSFFFKHRVEGSF